MSNYRKHLHGNYQLKWLLTVIVLFSFFMLSAATAVSSIQLKSIQTEQVFKSRTGKLKQVDFKFYLPVVQKNTDCALKQHQSAALMAYNRLLGLKFKCCAELTSAIDHTRQQSLHRSMVFSTDDLPSIS